METIMSEQRLMQGFPPAPAQQVTLANWRQPPFNRWAFSHVREILPTASIARARRPPMPLHRSPRALDRIAFQGPDGKERSIAGLLDETFTDGFLVMQRGRILFESYDGQLDPAQPHVIFSVSKSMTGTLAGVLVEEGSLDPEAPVTRYIPEAAGSAYGDCTLRHVLDMTVSTDFVEDYLDLHGDFARYRVATGWNPVDPAQATNLRGYLLTLRRGAEPHGRTHHYVSPNSDLLGWILERASGRPYARLLSGALWQPLGAEFEAYVALDRLGAARAAGGICMTLRDLARFGELMRCHGMAEGRQVIPGSWVDDIRRNGDAAAWRRAQSSKIAPHGRYRSKWYVLGNDHDAFCGIGIHGQWIYIDPAAEVTIAKLSSQPLPLDESLDFLHLAAFDAITRAVM
jgi:CubicO group peptidase (beta-lactamase class C family)